MIFFIYGSDRKRSCASLKRIATSFLNSKNPPSLYRIDEDSFSLEIFNNFLKTDNFFSKRNLVVAKHLLQNAQAVEYIRANLDLLSSSNNIFLFWEEDINPHILREIKRYGEVQKFDLPERDGKGLKKNKRDADLFRVADLVALKKKQAAWLLYQNLVGEGHSEEEIFWRIFGQFKSLVLVKKGGGKTLHPFVLSKAKRAVNLFEENELDSLLKELVELYHNYRNGAVDLGIGLERFILKI